MDVTPTLDQSLVNKLRTRMRLQDPAIETDEAYIFSDDNLWSIIEDSVTTFDKSYNSDSLPSEYWPYVLTLARREVFWQLATSTAPYYRLEAEGAVLEKNMRFDHYYKLIQLIDDEYELMLEQIGGSGVIESIDVTTKQYHYGLYNYEKQEAPTINLQVSGITATTVNLDWNKFNAKNGMFNAYKIYCETSSVVDPYAETPITATAKHVITDIHKNKYRLSNLLPNTLYYVVVVSQDRNTRYGYEEVSFTTLPAS